MLLLSGTLLVALSAGGPAARADTLAAAGARTDLRAGASVDRAPTRAARPLTELRQRSAGPRRTVLRVKGHAGAIPVVVRFEPTLLRGTAVGPGRPRTFRQETTPSPSRAPPRTSI